MEIQSLEADLWGGRHVRSNSNVQPPWESETPSPLGTPLWSPTSNGNGYGHANYDNSASSSPVEPVHSHSNSFSGTFPTHSYHYRNPSLSGISSDEKRLSFSGPLPYPKSFDNGYASPMGYRRQPSSLSGPLPGTNPYVTNYQGLSPSYSGPTLSNEYHASISPLSSTLDSIPPLKTPPPWIDSPDTTSTRNPYLNPLYDASGADSPHLSVSQSSLPQTLAKGHYISSSTNASPSRSANGYHVHQNHNRDQGRTQHLHGYRQPDSSLAAMASSSPQSNPKAASHLEHWASFANGYRGVNHSSKFTLMTGSSSPSELIGFGPARDSINGPNLHCGSLVTSRMPASPGLSRSTSVRSTQSVGGCSNATARTFSRTSSGNSLGSGDGVPSVQFTKGRGRLVDSVVETLARRLSIDHDRPNILSAMIFGTSKLLPSQSSASARDLVERILLVQLYSLKCYMVPIAVEPGVFERLNWIRKPALKHGNVEEQYPNEGFRLLRLQHQYLERGLETFDMLSRIGKQSSLLMAQEGGNTTGLLRIASFGGGPGCEALVLCLYFMRMCPKLQTQVDIFDGEPEWEVMIDALSLKNIGIVNVDLFDLVQHPTWLRSYRLLVFLDSLGKNMQARANSQWDAFWQILHQNTSASVFVIVNEHLVQWEAMKPKKGSRWWCSAVAEQESVYIARKV